MQHDPLTKTNPALPMMATWTLALPVPAEQSAHRQFVDAVVAFSEDSGPENLERYLAASRLLEESRAS
jgi:hypothetical protein